MKITAEEFIEIVKNLAEPASAIKQKAAQFDELNRQFQEVSQNNKTAHLALQEVEARHKAEMAVLRDALEERNTQHLKLIAEANKERDELRETVYKMNRAKTLK